MTIPQPRAKLPKIKVGERCIPGRSYRMDCNTCFCNAAKTLDCTKKGCVRPSVALPNFKPTSKLARPNLRVKKTMSKSTLPTLPVGGCVPGKVYRYKCRRCFCNEQGIPSCSLAEKGACKTYKDANMTIPQPRAKLPKIKVGERCIPGRSYRMDCNTCFCNAAKTLDCTKKGCVRPSVALPNFKPKSKLARPNLRVKKTMSKSTLPALPTGGCVPGKVYRYKCRRCFCNEQGIPSCSLAEKGACKTYKDGTPIPIKHPNDVRPPFKREELKKVQSLPTASTKCEPGKTYKVTCNHCLCTHLYNLLCTKELCLSFDDINRVEADGRSGKKCSGDTVTTKDCVQCSCVKGKTVCKEIPDCYKDTRMRLSKGTNDTLRMQIDAFKDQCVPEAIYTDNCNRCYCQADASLRCTQKTCLNYSQSKALDEQFQRMKQEEEKRIKKNGQ